MHTRVAARYVHAVGGLCTGALSDVSGSYGLTALLSSVTCSVYLSLIDVAVGEHDRSNTCMYQFMLSHHHSCVQIVSVAAAVAIGLVYQDPDSLTSEDEKGESDKDAVTIVGLTDLSKA